MSDGLTSNLRFTRVDAPIGALVEGFDPTEPIDERLVTPLANGLRDYSVLIFRDLTLDAGQLVALGRAFGELEILPEPDKRHPEHPEIFNLSNVGGDGQVVSFENPQSVFLRGTERWHTDSSFREIPCLCTMLLAREVPETGGETEFADMYGAWASLDEDEQTALAQVRLVHDYCYSRANNPGEMEPMSDAERAKYPAVIHPLVRTHGDGRRSLYLGGHVSHIAGTEQHGTGAIDASRDTIATLTERVTQPEFVYRHHWQAGDLVVWDNRSTLHRLRPYDIAAERRVMQRITVAGTEPVR